MQRAQIRRRLSPALFVGGIVLAVAAVHQAQQAVRSHRETSARLIRDYGAFAAWSFRQHATEALRGMVRAVLTPVVHAAAEGSAPGSLTAAEWRSRLSGDSAVGVCSRECMPSYHFRIALRDSRDAEFAGTVPDAAARATVTAAVIAHAASADRPVDDFATIHVGGEGSGRLVTYALVAAAPDRLVAYGFEFDPRRFAGTFRELFASGELLPAVVTGGRANDFLLGVDVRLRHGGVVFASSDSAQWAQRSTESFGDQLGGLRAGAAILQSAVGSLTGDSLSRTRLPLIAGLLALSCALAAVAVHQMRRDAQLARLRSDFVSSVSHELRTPLAQIQLFLETLRLGRHRTDEQREWILANMQREMTRLTALVDNVLHFSRGERGVMGGRREPTALAEYLEALIADFAPLASGRGVILTTRLEPGLVASLHRESFRQVILNLLDNAVKYGPKGQTVTLSAEAAGDRVRILVDDEGSGVEPRERQRIFEPFHRGERAVGSVAVGSGIGLSVAREIVEWHVGTIGVETAPGGGARLVVDLPAGEDAGEQIAHTRAGAASVMD